MKIIKIIGHPVLVITIFLLVIISGEQFGGFYLIYLLFGLPNGAPHSFFALVAIFSMLIGYTMNLKQFNKFKPLLFIVGDTLMVTALVVFFNGSKGYNDATFHQAIPLLTLILFGFCILSNLVFSISLLIRGRVSSKSNYGIIS